MEINISTGSKLEINNKDFKYTLTIGNHYQRMDVSV
jgi:hypothetical protein